LLQPREPPDLQKSRPNLPREGGIYNNPTSDFVVKDVLDADEQMSQGDDTEGVILKVPRSAPELQLPRVPPDRLKPWAQGHK